MGPSVSYYLGEVFQNPHLGCRITEVLDAKKQRAGFIWQHSDGRVVVSPHLGFYIWDGEKGKPWTAETAAQWLVKHRA